MGAMKTTLELPDALMRTIKVKAAREDRKLKDVVADLLERGLASEAPAKAPGHRVKFPLIAGTRTPGPGEELTPERIHEILLEQEVEWLIK